MKASGVFTNAWASASGLSSTMAMSISPPSFLMRAGLPSASARGLPLLCSHKGFVPTPQWLSALVIQFAVGSLGALGFLVPLGKRCRAVWRLA